jgi:hypothetical protein
MADYPDWFYYPPPAQPAAWVADFVEVVRSARPSVESRSVDALTSDQVLAFLRPGLEALGYEVEAGQHKSEKIRRPVLVGDRGVPRVAYEVDAVHDDLPRPVPGHARRAVRRAPRVAMASDGPRATHVPQRLAGDPASR